MPFATENDFSWVACNSKTSKGTAGRLTTMKGLEFIDQVLATMNSDSHCGHIGALCHSHLSNSTTILPNGETHGHFQWRNIVSGSSLKGSIPLQVSRSTARGCLSAVAKCHLSSNVPALRISNKVPTLWLWYNSYFLVLIGLSVTASTA